MILSCSKLIFKDFGQMVVCIYFLMLFLSVTYLHASEMEAEFLEKNLQRKCVKFLELRE